MNSSSLKRATVDAYIAAQSPDIQTRLTQIRQIIHAQCPEAVESISYGMPAYKLNKKPLIYYAAFPHHIGLYATPSGHQAFADELAGYKQGKGSVQFPLDKSLPLDLIEKIVRFKREENTKQ